MKKQDLHIHMYSICIYICKLYYELHRALHSTPLLIQSNAHRDVNDFMMSSILASIFSLSRWPLGQRSTSLVALVSC